MTEILKRFLDEVLIPRMKAGRKIQRSKYHFIYTRFCNKLNINTYYGCEIQFLNECLKIYDFKMSPRNKYFLDVVEKTT